MNVPSKRETTSVALAFAGFAVLVLVFRGTWSNAWHAMLGGSPKGAAGASGDASAQGGALAYPVHAGTLAFAGVTAGRPGQSPTPTTRTVAQAAPRGPSYVPHALQIGGQTYMGQLTEGGKGETEFFSTKDQAVGGVLAWRGAGHYTRVKLPGDPGGGRDTEWVWAGA